MNLKTDAAHLAKRKEKKDQQRKELENLNLDEVLNFQTQIKEAWQHRHQISYLTQKQNQQQDDLKPQEALKKEIHTHIRSTHLQSAQQSFDQMQDQQIRHQLKKQLLRDYELGEHFFEINIQNLGKINITANIKQDAWHFALSAEKSSTQNWLSRQRDDLVLGLHQNSSKKIALTVI
jgi:hypothetical protein